MKRKISKTVLILTFVLAISGMTGCGKQTETVSTDQNAEKAEESKEEPVTEEDGKGDLITDENQFADSDEEHDINGLVLKGPSYTGLTELYQVDNEDGSYIYQDMTEDGITVITNMCAHDSKRDGQEPDAYAENFVCAVVDDTKSATITDSKADDDLSSSLTYPAYRIHWETGANEDSRQNVGVVVLTDNFTFYYGYGCPVDYYDENADLYESGLETIELIDLTDMDAVLNDEEAGEAFGAEGSDRAYGVYLDKINELKSEGLADQFALVNIDEDDVPELIASDSQGSYDHENAFIFTIFNDEVVQLAAVISGVDGGNLDYAKGSNLIHISGAAAGMREVFSKINDGKLEEVFTAESTSMDEDAKYSVNGSNVKEDEYYKQINEFAETYNPMTRIAYDGLYEVNYKYDNGYGGFEQGGSEKYSSAEDITKELQ